MTIKTLIRTALLVTGLAAASLASAAAEKFAPSTLSAARSGYWVGAFSGGPDPTGDVALLRYENDGTLVFAKPYGSAQGFKDSQFREFLPLRDGGAIVVGESLSAFGTLPPAYSFHRVDATGAPVWSLTAGLASIYYPDDNFDTFGTFLLGNDADGNVWFPANGHVYLVNTAGALTDFGQASSSPDEDYASAVDPSNGTLYFALADASNLLTPVQLQRYTLNGSKTSLWTAPDTATRLQFLTVGSDGNVYAIGNNATTHIAISFSPNGSVRWSKTFGSALYAFANNSEIAKQAAAFADGSIVALDTSGALYLINTTGQIQQIPDSAYVPSQFGDTFVGVASPNDIVLSAEESVFLRLTTTGQVLANLPVEDTLGPTLLSDGTMMIPTITPNGVVLLHADRNGHDLGNAPTLIASLDAPALMRVDQIGLDGAWFVGAESGQGFTIDYVPANNVLFLPWFTYSVDPASDTSGLAWITFQGSPAPGATSATLSIARQTPGTFNSGTTTSQIIGSAVLTATDCSNARLQYQFDDGQFGGLGGYMPLVRIGSSTTPCIGANEQTTPPQAADVALNGFDPNQSGSWFDPNTSGQGIEFTVIPISPGLPSGLVFGAWFTFDAPPANDASHEHWFTMQASLSSAVNGTLTMPILQTIGGALDKLPATGTTQVGTVTLSMLSCTSATMAYHFDNSAAAKTFAGLNGTINLSKIGGCVTQ